MTKNKVLYYFDEQLEWLETCSYPTLKKWILGMLRDKDSYPLFISLDTISLGDIVQDFFERSNNDDLRSKVKRIIIELINDWRMDRDPDTMLLELSILVGHLCITRARSKLLSLAKEGYLRNRKCRGIDLHFHLLRVLAGLKLSTDLKLIIQRDFDSPIYAPILFISSWLLSEKGYFFAIELLDRFIHLHKKYPFQMEFYPPLRKFLESFGQYNLQKHFKLIKNKLSPENVSYFLACLEKVGIDVDFIERLEDGEKRGHAKNHPVQPQYVSAPKAEYETTESLQNRVSDIKTVYSHKKPLISYPCVPIPDKKSGIVDPNEALLYLAERVRSGNLAPMVGAGASASAGLPSWLEIGEVLKEILNKTDSEWDDVPELASRYVDRLEKHLHQPEDAKVKLILLIEKILKSLKDSKKQDDYGQIIPRLVRLPVDSFYTTNWDELLEKSLLQYATANDRGVRHLDNQTARYETNISHGETRDVVYLHGTLTGPHEQFIITSNDYKYFENKAAHVFKRLLKQFKEDTTMLCIGYSFSDLLAADYIQKALIKGHPASNVYALFSKIPVKRAKELLRYRAIYSISLTHEPSLIEEAVCRFLDLLNDAIEGKPVRYIPPEKCTGEKRG